MEGERIEELVRFRPRAFESKLGIPLRIWHELERMGDGGDGLDWGESRLVGVGGFEPPTSWPQTRRSNLTELHPGRSPC